MEVFLLLAVLLPGQGVFVAMSYMSRETLPLRKWEKTNEKFDRVIVDCSLQCQPAFCCCCCPLVCVNVGTVPL